MAVPYNQDRPALFEELRFAKRQQWYVAASAVALNAAVIAATRDFKKLHWIEVLVATVFVVGVAWGSVRLLWQLQRHLRSVRFALNPYDREAGTRGVDIAYQLTIVVLAVAVGVLCLLWLPHVLESPLTNSWEFGD